MFEQLLGRLIGGGLGASATDALSSAAIDVVVEQYLTPLAAEVRRRLLDALSGEPPATFRVELAAIGLVVSDEQLALLWGAAFRAIANDKRVSLAIESAEGRGFAEGEL